MEDSAPEGGPRRKSVACCALAAFLFSQIIFVFDWAGEWLGTSKPTDLAANPVVAWRLDAAPALGRHARASPSRRMASRTVLAAAGGMATFAVLAGLTLSAGAGQRDGIVTWICTGHGLQRLVVRNAEYPRRSLGPEAALERPNP